MQGIEFTIYYEKYTDSDKHWVCRFGKEVEDFFLGKTPEAALQGALGVLRKEER